MAEGHLSTPKVQSNELQNWHKTNPIEELFYSQKEIARFLELGYLALRDHPVVAAEIRSTAHKSRTQHVLTAGLFKKFVVTASSVVNTYCPMMMKAVELQDKDIVIEAFEQVLQMCLDMKKETEDARNSYLKIQEKVQNDISKANITKKQIQTEVETIELKQKADRVFVKEAERQQKELEKEEEELQKKVNTIRKNRDQWLDKAAPPSDIREGAHTVIDFAMIPTGALIAGPIGAAIGAVATGLNIWRKKEKAKQAVEASREADAHLTSTYEEKRKVSEKAWERRQQTLEKLAHIEALDMQKASFGDIKSLQEAVLQLGNVDKQFLKIIMFWDSMATMLKHLHQDQKAGGIYLKKIEKEAYAKEFKLSINRTEFNWNRIGIVCQNYVEINDKVIFNIYGFLSSPVDNMTDDEIKKKKKSRTR